MHRPRSFLKKPRILKAKSKQRLQLLTSKLSKVLVTLMTPVPSGFAFQSIDVRAVADRLVELATSSPAGRARDIGGPRVDSLADLVQLHGVATGKSRPLLHIRIPGKIGHAFRSGMNLLGPDGERIGGTFDDYLAERISA